MPPPNLTLAGLDLPLLEYSNPLFRDNKHVGFEDFTDGLYRVALRCYALEMLPRQLMGVREWRQSLIDLMDPGAVMVIVSEGARFRARGSEPRHDSHIKFEILSSESTRKRVGFTHVPKMRVASSWWDERGAAPPANPPLTSVEHLLYKHKVLKVISRVATVGFNFFPVHLFKSHPEWMYFPDLRRGFSKPHPGAVVKSPEYGVGWVIRETGPATVVVEFVVGEREYEQYVMPIGELQVLG